MKKSNKKEKSSGQTFSISNYSRKTQKNQVKSKLNPICYEIHNYLKKYAIGYQNRKTSSELIKIFNIKSDDILRECIREIRDSDIFHKTICSKSGSGGNGYWIATDVDEIIKSANALEKRGWNCIKRAKIMKRKARLNRQKRITFSKYEKDIIESVINDG